MPKVGTDIGWKEITLGLNVPLPGSARDNFTGSWRSERPLWNDERCVQCGVCDMYCPEGCIKPNAAGKYGANLDYCKGCGICFRECPTGAITMKTEEL